MTHRLRCNEQTASACNHIGSSNYWNMWDGWLRVYYIL